MLDEDLKTLGLDSKEIAVYLAIVKNGKTRAAALGRNLGIKRTTVYSIIKELQQKNLVYDDLGEPVLSYVAAPPEKIYELIQNEEKILARKKQNAQNAIEQLQKLSRSASLPIPKIISVPDHQIERHLYRQTPLWAESIRKTGGTWWGFQDPSFVKSYEGWIDWSWESGVQRGINLKLISNEEERKIKNKAFPDRTIKFWNQSKHFTATTWICGDYVIMLTTSQRPHHLVEIYDKVLAHNLREIFRGIWHSQIEKTP